MDGKSLVLRTDFQLSTRIPLPTSLRSATFPPGEGITQINRNLRQQNRIGRNQDAQWAARQSDTNCQRTVSTLVGGRFYDHSILYPAKKEGGFSPKYSAFCGCVPKKAVV